MVGCLQAKQSTADLHLAPELPRLLMMQNIRTKVFQLTAESAADNHQLHQLRRDHQLRCQHAGNGGPAEVKLRSTSYKSKALSEFLCKPLLAIVTALYKSKHLHLHRCTCCFVKSPFSKGCFIPEPWERISNEFVTFHEEQLKWVTQGRKIFM